MGNEPGTGATSRPIVLSVSFLSRLNLYMYIYIYIYIDIDVVQVWHIALPSPSDLAKPAIGSRVSCQYLNYDD